ncbi:ABC transporter substrate-binding protein [Flagellimonas allohymeniacidonis]|uniref:ABC transporter substrate-binding protein n=1 Tax=Flagellimonas allohymeniacidonis TaxID=2517819 RepID=A0A4Q8QF90_9FLAO|nr:ABC transporter substrate-binding protein [Allomuricauda hymeniacidonis]TAI49145.1 ABC transporter substrate-binding protein [Allomuricauda hymeniacidonis]
MLKLCSFMPAVTQMIYDMGLQDQLYGVTFECPEQALKEKKPVVRCILEGKNLSSREIDAVFSASKHQGKDLYYVDETLLEQISPDVIFTQDMCDICQIDTACTAAAVANLPKQPELISVSPESLEDVFRSAVTIAKAAEQEERAYEYLNGLNHRIQRVVDKLRKARALPKRVMLMEWLDPIFNCGHWIPHQIALAGGVDMLSNPSGDSVVTQWERIVKYDPEILVIAPCGFSMDRTFEEIHLLTKKKGWKNLQAVQNHRVFIADFDMFTQSSAKTLVDGIEVLAGLFHPEVIEVPQKLLTKYKTFQMASTH